MATTWIDRLERKYGDWALPNLPGFVVGLNAVVYVMCAVQPEFYGRLVLDPALIWKGEVWRAVTFLIIPPLGGHPLFLFFFLYLLYIYASQLEAEWGEFRFTLYYAMGAAATVVAALLVGQGLPNVFFNGSIFLAFAALYPDFELLLFFVLPVKVKWLAFLTAAYFLLLLVLGSWGLKAAVLSGTLNYWIFFGRMHYDDFQLWLKVRRNRKKYNKAHSRDDDND